MLALKIIKFYNTVQTSYPKFHKIWSFEYLLSKISTKLEIFIANKNYN